MPTEVYFDLFKNKNPSESSRTGSLNRAVRYSRLRARIEQIEDLFAEQHKRGQKKNKNRIHHSPFLRSVIRFRSGAQPYAATPFFAE